MNENDKTNKPVQAHQAHQPVPPAPVQHQTPPRDPAHEPTESEKAAKAQSERLAAEQRDANKPTPQPAHESTTREQPHPIGTLHGDDAQAARARSEREVAAEKAAAAKVPDLPRDAIVDLTDTVDKQTGEHSYGFTLVDPAEKGRTVPVVIKSMEPVNFDDAGVRQGIWVKYGFRPKVA